MSYLTFGVNGLGFMCTDLEVLSEEIDGERKKC